MSIKTERIASSLVKEISYVIMTEVTNKHVKFVTITDCKVTTDLSYAKVYYTVLNEEYKEETAKALKSAAGFIRRNLFDRVDIRNIPHLEFIYDESIEYANKIEKMIDDLHEDDTK